MKNKRVYIYGLMFVIGILLVLRQQNIVISERNQEKLNNFSEWQKKGKPVVVMNIQRQTVNVYSKITAVPVSEKEFESFVPLSIQRKLKTGQSFYIKGENRRVGGKILSVSDQIDMDTGLFHVALSLGSGVKTFTRTIIVYVNTDSIEDVFCVSNDVIDYQKDEYVLWIAENGKARLKMVTIQQRNGYGAIIASGLEEGDLLITEGFSQLFEGDQLNFLNSQKFEEK